MAIVVKQAIRRFEFDGMEIMDPGPEFSVEEVREITSARRPDILTAVVEETVKGDVIEYKFIRNVGSKGMRHSTAVAILTGKKVDINCIRLHEITSPEVTRCVDRLANWLHSSKAKSGEKLQLESQFIVPLF